jgi:hypothetical protein
MINATCQMDFSLFQGWSRSRWRTVSLYRYVHTLCCTSSVIQFSMPLNLCFYRESMYSCDTADFYRELLSNRRPTLRHTPRSCEGRMLSVFPGVILIAGDHHHATAPPPSTVRRPGALSACRDHTQHPQQRRCVHVLDPLGSKQTHNHAT